MYPTLRRNKLTPVIRYGMFLLVVIGIAMVIRRSLAITGLLKPVSPGGGPPFDGGFARHPLITFVHILSGALFLLSGTLQFLPGIRQKYPRLHRRNGRVLLCLGYVVGISALALPFIIPPIGGSNEAAATLLFDCYFLVALSKAWWYIRKRQVALHREWMIRAFAITLAVATIRPIIGLFFIFSHQPPQVFFGTAFWLGFTLHAIGAEAWVHSTRSPLQVAE